MTTFNPGPAAAAPPAAADPVAAFTESFAPKRAVSYLRVSTREQAERGGREEGFSIPAQRDANKKKATSMGAMVVKEFVERGVSGTSTNRPALQAMLRYLEEEQATIDYVIVHKVDRLARNRADDVTLNARFDELGIRLVSTSENIDQTPGGILLHGIMSSIAEFYSKNLSNEVKKGMTEKVRSGGSVGRAPIGYLNVRHIDDGREVRTVEVDLKRAPLVTWAFKTYATGDWSVRSLTDELIKRGLTMAKTTKLPEKPVETRQVHQILTNPYYLGIVSYKGAQYPGNHEPLIDQETFQKVRGILKSKINGERTITHGHYLKSTLYCGECGMRMIVQVAKPRTEEEYPYYSCLGRHSKRNDCMLRSINFYKAEDLIQEMYDRLALRAKYADNLREVVAEQLRLLKNDTAVQAEALNSQKLEIERRQRKLLEAHYNDAIPLDMLATEQKRLDVELVRVKKELDALTADLGDAARYVDMAIDLAQQCADAYRQAPDHHRRMFNQLLFERIEVYMDENDEHQVRAILAPPFDELFSSTLKQIVSQMQKDQRVEEKENPAISGGVIPVDFSISHALVSNKSTMVGLTGFEPATP
ncbi:recombinase family protein [Mycetocola sp. BIGb0189]|uniref:recombinase family protein n=1 Tax=Mycetocola sp. BIGb0189 TaxID=2940604 RepID=UPI002166F42D|nr:recombinase family protein [Mycetocola sp. BIGb0189]